MTTHDVPVVFGVDGGVCNWAWLDVMMDGGTL